MRRPPRHRAAPARRAPARTATALAVAVAAATAISLVPTSAASAATDDELRQRQGELAQQQGSAQEQLDTTSAAAQAAQAALDEVTAAQPAAQAQLEAAQAELAQARERDAALASQLAAAQQEEGAAQEAITASAGKIDATKSSLARVAAQAYRTGGVNSSLAVALDAQSPQDFTDRYVMVDVALRSQADQLGRLQQAKAVQTNQEARLVAVRERVGELKAEAARNVERTAAAEQAATDRKAELDALEAQRSQALATLEAEKESYRQQVAAAQSAADSIGTELANRAAERERQRVAAEAAAAAAAARRGAPAPPSTAPRITSSAGTLGSPLAGGFTVTSSFGMRMHPVYHVMRLHAGTDMGAACGTPVYAAADGQVVSASPVSGYGNYLTIDHGIVAGRPVATAYAHLSRFVASPGQQVRRGQLVAYSGSTGVGTACHLHFEVRIAGTPVDPLPWLR